ncbi:MAG: metallophosphoesterase family protein [Bryobacteraceae bacterium]|nr:metallophosphoesterase family protein [Bryobacteraceae bacterium]
MFTSLLFLLAYSAEPFLQVPYLQLGPARADATRLSLMWHTENSPASFSVYTRTSGATKWTAQPKITWRRIAVREIEPHLVYTAELTGLKPGAEFDYEVRRENQPVFTARGLARKTAAQRYQFAVFGDCGQNNTPQRQIAKQVQQRQPDFIQVTGDIVYSRGRISEYREKFYPIYNSEALPLLRARPIIGVVGNHDTAATDLGKYPDTLAYYYYWHQPLNGPETPERKFEGSPADLQAVQSGAGEKLNRMGSFSFTYGNSYWIAVDSNTYLDWSTPQLSAWLEKELKASQAYTWRFVTMHHPAFNSSVAHFKEQHPRWMTNLFEKYRVDLVLAGHVHNYQRTYPLQFAVSSDAPKKGVVDGKFAFDKEFDGVTKTKAKLPIYLVTGAGGAGLYDKDQGGEPGTWQSFTHKFVSNVNSFSWFEIEGKKLSFRQIDVQGREVDCFTLTK